MSDTERDRLVYAVLAAVQEHMNENRSLGPNSLAKIAEQFVAPIRLAIV